MISGPALIPVAIAFSAIAACGRSESVEVAQETPPPLPIVVTVPQTSDVATALPTPGADSPTPEPDSVPDRPVESTPVAPEERAPDPECERHASRRGARPSRCDFELVDDPWAN